MLGGAGLGAAAGGLIGALTDMGVPEEDARHYEDQVRQGKSLVTVRVDNDNEADRASHIMQVEGAEDVEGRSSQGNVEAASDYQGKRSFDSLDSSKQDSLDNSKQRSALGGAATRSDRDFRTSESALAGQVISDKENRDEATGLNRKERDVNDTATIPVTEERLVVGKTAVESGRVRIYGRVIEKPVEESVQLRDERVSVERRAVDRPVADVDRKDQVMIEITEMREEPVVGKQERVVEEIVIGKTVQERTEIIRDTVRRKDVEVERTGSELDEDERAHGRR